MDLTWALPIISAALSFIGGLAGAYFGGYLKTKGANLATHEDIELLKEKVATVTTTTEQIKTEISDAAWNRQKRWELKREVLFEAAKRVVEVDEAIVAFNNDKWRHAIVGFDEATILVGMTCGKETLEALEQFRNTANKFLASVRNRNPMSFNSDSDINILPDPELYERRKAVQVAIRKELGIEEQE